MFNSMNIHDARAKSAIRYSYTTRKQNYETHPTRILAIGFCQFLLSVLFVVVNASSLMFFKDQFLNVFVILKDFPKFTFFFFFQRKILVATPYFSFETREDMHVARGATLGFMPSSAF